MSQQSYREAAALLRRGIERVKRGWCRFYQSKSAKGNLTRPWSKRSVCWCMLGAITECRMTERGSDYFTALESLQRWTLISPTTWQDHPGRTQAEVLAVMEVAAADLERRSQS